MDTTIISSEHRIVVLEKEGTRYLGIQLMESQKARELSIFAGLKKEHGWIISGDRFEPWRVTGFLEAEGKVCFYGPYYEGTLLSRLLDHPAPENLPHIQKLTSTLAFLQKKQFGLTKLYTNGVLFLEDGRVLFLPWKIMEELDRIQEKEHHLSCFEQVNHPEKQGEDNISFSVAVLVYSTLTGKIPFRGATEEEIREQIREQTILSPKLENPDLRWEVSDTVMTALGKQPGDPLSLNNWEKELQEWLQRGITEPVSEEDRKLLREQAQRRKEQSKKQQKRRQYFFKNRTKLLITAAALAAAVWIGSSILKNILSPRATAGQSPQEVVRMFYESIDNLDSEILEDCLDKRVKVPELQEILNLYVVSRVRTAYEGSSGLINAEAWIESGMPTLEPDQFVFGITSLEITREKEDVYLVSYEKWITRGDDEEDPMEPANPVVEGLSYEVRVYLRDTGRYWVITEIEELSERKIPYV